MMKARSWKKPSGGVKRAAAAVACMALALSMASTPFFQTKMSYADSDIPAGKYYTDFATLADAQAAAEEHQIQVQAEGTVLLKNTNAALPLEGTEWISVFGEMSDGLGGYSFIQALKDEGFKVNNNLVNYYATDGGGGSSNVGVGAGMGNKTFPSGTQETHEFNAAVQSSFNSYNDAAIIVLRRGGGEGSKADGGAAITTEVADDAEEKADGWSHENLGTIDGETVKHSSMLSDDERALLETVKNAGFKKIIYVISSALPMEVKLLEDDPEVDGMLWMGTPGDNGTKAVAKILSGEFNPSGRASDTWYTDFTADPTWKNLANNNHNGAITTTTDEDGDTVYTYANSSTYLDGDGELTGYVGIDYEEDIYRGYRYYETRAYEMNKAETGSGDNWYKTAMTYPFGYGLSYTTFEYSNFTVTLDDNTVLADEMELDADTFACDTGVTDYVKTATATVTVKNTGNVAGKETVQIYSSAPYTGLVEKSHVVLVGYGKTDTLNPGESQTLTIEFNIQDMASYDALGAASNGEDKGYVLEGGDYTIYAIASSHGWAESGIGTDANRKQSVTFTLSDDAYLLLDDYSGNETSNVYSAENGMNYTLRDNTNETYKASHYQINVDATANMTQLSRADLGAETTAEIESFPVAPTVADRTLTDDALNALAYWNNFRIGETVEDYKGNALKDTSGNAIIYEDGQTIQGTTGTIVNGDMDFPWMATVDTERMKSWTQATTELTGRNTADILVSDLAGIDPNGSAEDQALWDKFMNQLTWTQVESLIATMQKSEIAAIGYNAYSGSDSALDYAGTYGFNCNSVLAATFNSDLAKAQGVLVGNFALLSNRNVWWGPGGQTHRSYFDNRASEYCSEDPYLAGMMSSREVIGVQSKGVVACVKHCAMYDDSGSVDGVYTVNADNGSIQWASEQAIREIILKSFQMCAQEGGAYGMMGSFNRFGRVASCSSWNTTTNLFRTQWGCDQLTWTTDIYFRVGAYSPIDLLTRAGADNIDQKTHITGTWDAEKSNVMVPTGEDGALEASDITWYVTRMNAMRIVSLHANSAMNRNAVSFADWAGSSFTATQGTSLASTATVAATAAAEEAEVMEYSVTAGALPAGVSLNSSTGVLSGTPTESGTFSFTVTCRADGWISSTQTFTMNVASAFAEAGLTGATGTTFAGFVYSETFDSGVYTLAEGTLPAGLELLEDGSFVGTPTEAGTFPVTVDIAVTSGRNTVHYTYETQIVITSETVDAIADLTARLDALTAQVNAIEGYDDTELQAAIDEIKAELDALDAGDDSDLQASIDALAQRVAALEAAQSGEEEGGGCGSSIAVGSAAAVAAALLGASAAAIVLRKRKNG